MSRSYLRNQGLETLEPRMLLSVNSVIGGEGEGSAQQVADFALIDVNPTSATFDQPVSPRDYLGQVTGWYFGHAT